MEPTKHVVLAFARLPTLIAERGDKGVRDGHLLLVLLDAADSAAERALSVSGIDLDNLRTHVEATLPRNPPTPEAGEYPYLKSGVRVLRASTARASNSGGTLSTSHFLLGILDTDGDAATVLASHGDEVVARLRTALLEDWNDEADPNA